MENIAEAEECTGNMNCKDRVDIDEELSSYGWCQRQHERISRENTHECKVMAGEGSVKYQNKEP